MVILKEEVIVHSLQELCIKTSN